MIRAIVAIDNKRGVADDHGIPWDLPADRQHFREMTEGQDVLMGYNTYQTLKNPLQNRRNFVWCSPGTDLRPGFESAHGLESFLGTTSQDLWVMGGAALYAAALAYCQELYITQIDQDFNCTKFFPPFTDQYQLAEQSSPITENNAAFTYQLWRQKAT